MSLGSVTIQTLKSLFAFILVISLNIFNFTPLKAKIPDPCSVLSLPSCLLLQTNPNIREKSDEPNIQILTIIIKIIINSVFLRYWIV